MNPETLERATKVVAMIHALQEEIDLLSKDKMVFRNEIKYRGRLFSQELQKFIYDFYKAMNAEENSTEAEMHYYQHIKVIEELLRQYFSGEIQVIDDPMENAKQFDSPDQLNV